MNANIDFSTIPILNLITLGIIIIIGIIILKKVGITKLGPIEIEHEGQATNALVLKRLDDIDIKLHDGVSSLTNRMMKQFLPPGDALCYYGRRAITESILIPLRKRAACNHFTTHLMRQHRAEYKQMIMDGIRDYYVDAVPTNTRGVCSSTPHIQPWVEVEPQYSTLIDDWLRRTALLTKDACQEKVDVYNQALSSVKGNKYWTQVFTECRDKNLNYIKELSQ